MENAIHIALGAAFLATLLCAYWERRVLKTRFAFTTMFLIGVAFIIAVNVAAERKNVTASVIITALALVAYTLVLGRALVQSVKRSEPAQAYWLLQIVCSGTLLVGLTGVLFLYGAGTAEDQQARQYEPRFAALVATVNRCLEQLPPEGTLREGPRPGLALRPKPTKENSAFASVAGLRTPKEAPSKVFEDVFGTDSDWSSRLHKWRPGEGQITGGLPERAAVYDRILGTRYLVVVRLVRWDDPVVSEAQRTYVPGKADVEVFLFSLEEPRLLAAFPLSVSGPPTIGFGVIAGRSLSAEESAQLGLRSSLKKGVASELRKREPDWPDSNY
jgi:hypothetical protein